MSPERRAGSVPCWDHLHSNVVRDDGLLLELELLENIGLQDLLNLCRKSSVSDLGLYTDGEAFTHGSSRSCRHQTPRLREPSKGSIPS